MSNALEVIHEALSYSIELFEDNDLEVTPNMFKALDLVERMQSGNN